MIPQRPPKNNIFLAFLLTISPNKYKIVWGDILNKKPFIKCLTASAVLAAAIRTVQLTVFTDNATGFYTDSFHILGTVCSYVIIAIIAACLVFAIVTRQKAVVSPSPTVSTVLSELLLGLSLAGEPFWAAQLPGSIPAAFTVTRFALMVVSGLIFIYFGISHLIGKPTVKQLHYIIIVMWIMRVLVTFMCYTGMSNIPSNLYDVAMLCFALLFFNYNAKLDSGVATVKDRSRALICGIPAFLTALVCSVPKILQILIFGANSIHRNIDSPISSLCLAFYVLVCLLSRESRSTRKIKEFNE